jgi:hypothetical protein
MTCDRKESLPTCLIVFYIFIISLYRYIVDGRKTKYNVAKKRSLTYRCVSSIIRMQNERLEAVHMSFMII